MVEIAVHLVDHVRPPASIDTTIDTKREVEQEKEDPTWLESQVGQPL